MPPTTATSGRGSSMRQTRQPPASASPNLPRAFCRSSLPKVERLADQRLRNATELAFLLHGLEFACVRIDVLADSFGRSQQITFGAGANETELTDQNESDLRELIVRLFSRRSAAGEHNDPLYRMRPERWLESVLRKDVSLLDERLDPACLHPGSRLRGVGPRHTRPALDLQ